MSNPEEISGEDQADPRWLPPKPKRDRSLLIAGAVVAVGLVIGLVFSLFGGSNPIFGKDDSNVVSIGTTEGSADYWPILQRLAAEQGITIRVVNFADYSQPNPALAQGQTDLNLFQHLQFLASYNVSANQNLTPIGSTVVVPLGLYSRRYSSVEQIPNGADVAIPNDPTNQARALLVLQQAGLVKLRDGGSTVSTPADVLPAGTRVRVVPISAQQTVTSLPSVAAAVINNGFAMDANIDPSSAIYNDDPNSPAAEPYINAFVSREQDKDNPTYQEIVKLYHDPKVTKAVVDASRGTAVIVDKPAADLQHLTDELEAQIRQK
ncbi:MetQ/NlpA family ABC transporter substrate-binding protein [Mycobacterium sp. DL592]|uniref:MetQ/NlpA family ABC transporter substrate-binding protein n=1 Tax=Mycobacterium sp. DL592 TaxID=2675524 RepID=UPI001AAFFFA8|nr:MetQ/NlpA family ABC transporter substrate-binding protein [Mycobacterium sp. DL592]